MRLTSWALVLAVAHVAAAWHWRPRFVPVPRTDPASVLAVNFQNFGEPAGPLGTFLPPRTPDDPVRTLHWRAVATLRAALRSTFAEAQRRRLDDTRTEGAHRAALDLVFACTHSALIPMPGEHGERVGNVISDRSQPSPARAAILAVFADLADAARGTYPGVRVHTVFLLNCGSVEDTGDHRTIDRAIRAMTGAPPARILTTSDQVNPDYRDVCAGYAGGHALVITDARPGGPHGTVPRAVPVLRIAPDGHYHFGTGLGHGLSAPVR